MHRSPDLLPQYDAVATLLHGITLLIANLDTAVRIRYHTTVYRSFEWY